MPSGQPWSSLQAATTCLAQTEIAWIIFMCRWAILSPVFMLVEDRCHCHVVCIQLHQYQLCRCAHMLVSCNWFGDFHAFICTNLWPSGSVACSHTADGQQNPLQKFSQQSNTDQIAAIRPPGMFIYNNASARSSKCYIKAIPSFLTHHSVCKLQATTESDKPLAC